MFEEYTGVLRHKDYRVWRQYPPLRLARLKGPQRYCPWSDCASSMTPPSAHRRSADGAVQTQGRPCRRDCPVADLNCSRSAGQRKHHRAHISLRRFHHRWHLARSTDKRLSRFCLPRQGPYGGYSCSQGICHRRLLFASTFVLPNSFSLQQPSPHHPIISLFLACAF